MAWTIRRLLGNSKDEKLMQLFLSLTSTVLSGMESLKLLLEDYGRKDQRDISCFEIERLEQEGDALVAQIIKQVGEISITSWIGHEMVLRLVHLMDQVLDGSFGIVRTLKIYQLDEINNDMVLLGRVIAEDGVELNAMMQLFCQPRWQKHTEQIRLRIEKISRLEHQADELRAQGLQALWQSGKDDQPLTQRDMAMLKGSDEIVKALETITDDVHHVATTIHQNLTA